MASADSSLPLTRFTVLAWNDLGMHCMDSDYSLFSLLPPYNNLRAQVIDRSTGREVKGDVTVTYEAVADPSGSCNTEMTCLGCHSSGGDPMAQPSGGWANDPTPERDWRRNILMVHDDRNQANPTYAAALAQMGYDAQGLAPTAQGGHPVLCGSCHATNALGTAGVAGVKRLTVAMHSWHAHCIQDSTGLPLDDSTNRTACYVCHPGSVTRCLRGAMGNAKDAQGNNLIECQSCHGRMSTVGAATRQGWVDMPSCQDCHYLSPATGGYVRDTTTLDPSGAFRQGAGVFGTGTSLYKLSSGHGNVQCEACHGSTHAEYPAGPSDNVQPEALQGYAAVITECRVCHASVPFTASGGPHGLHTLGQEWVSRHGPLAKVDRTHCRTCHGPDLRGTFLSRTGTSRTFDLGVGRISFAARQVVSCYDCHRSF